MIYIHPVFGALAAAALLWVGSQGFRARHRARYASAARALHRRYAPWMYGSVAAVAVVGTASVLLLREDLEVAGSRHFWLLWGVVALLSAGAWTSRSLPGDAMARRVHPWLGLGAMLGALVGVALGLGLLP